MAFNDDEMPSTYNTGSTKGLVTMKPVKYFKDAAALTADTVTAEVEINATSSAAVREGLDLVAVLDVSGGMDGEKMDSLKKGMAFVIAKLSPMDRLSVVTFSDAATRLSPLRSVTTEAQVELKALVDGLRASGRSNIQAGLETGLAVIADRVNTKTRVASIFLVSDGHQTSGDARNVEPSQVPIYTFCFGKGADDEELMTDIAAKSLGGTFSFVPDGSKVTVPFSQLLAGLLTVVAQDVEVTITPNTEGGDVDAVEVVPGAEYMQSIDAATGVVTISFGTLFAGERRKVVVNLTLKDVSAAAGEAYEAALAETQLSFTAQGKARNRQSPQDIEILRQFDALTMTSHGRQRYASRGSDEDAVRLFATPRMDTYLQQAMEFEKDPTVPVPSAQEDNNVKEEIMADPRSATSTELRFYLRNIIESLQAIEKILAPST